ncbi:DMT family transporter [Pseudohoeflea coraliihabitans]|uniref:DMT family transporter n=1 Tax=Pseudohoeflea coraliihabitans TaxID=2860393 RepID=A0ABS6WMH9_9HYPH|nr:DMT family transporter [Pseudohoeflea sp. DP4N28-3]MBW3096284.1 DMT family transporter [Pseudohoeflea sp. DP4N28-3]
MLRTAYLLLILTALFWSGNAIAGKLAVGHVSPMLLTALRWGMATALMATFSVPYIRRDWPVIRKHWWQIAAYGALGFAAFNVCLYTALEYTTAINVVIFQAGMPVVIFLANFLIFRIAAGRNQTIGFVLTLTGVALVASNGHLETLLGLQLNRGDAFMLLGVLFYGGYTVMLRYKPKLHWQSIMTLMSLAAFLFALPFAAWEIGAARVIWPGWEGWTIATYTAIFPSIFAQVLFIKGNEAIGSNRAGLFINLVPIFGTFLSVLLLGEVLELYHVLALSLVIGGIALAEKQQRVKLEGPAP